MKTLIKLLGLFVLYLVLCFVESLVFLMIYGTGAQAGMIMDDTATQGFLYLLPLLVVGWVALKMFKKK